MIEFKANTICRLPVLLVNATTGAPVTGVAAASITATVEKSDGTTANFSPTAPEWVEVAAGAFASQGKYTLLLPAALANLPGVMSYAVSDGASKVYLGVVKLIANEEAETKAVVDTLQTEMVDLLDYHQGKWSIEVTGGDANRLVLYRADGVTVLKKFDLQNAAGSPTYINPFKRIPV